MLPGDQGNILECCCAFDVTDAFPICEQICENLGVVDDDAVGDQTAALLPVMESSSSGVTIAIFFFSAPETIAVARGCSLASSARWAEEEQIPTHLGADQQMAYLATYLEGRLVPFHQEEFAWDKSSLRIRLGSLHYLIMTEDEEIAIENLRKTRRKFYENDLIVVLKKKDSFWRAKGESANGTSILVNYDQIRGWQLTKMKTDD